jgi:hypothetical protein
MEDYRGTSGRSVARANTSNSFVVLVEQETGRRAARLVLFVAV